ncbi:Arm DNA-binding domain-containing protein [Actinomadura syzygii]
MCPWPAGLSVLGCVDGAMVFIKGSGRVYRRCGCVDPQSGKALGAGCPKLGAGRRHGSWYVRLELPVGSDGRRRRVRRGGFGTRKAAEEALARLGKPSGAGGGLLTVGAWLAQWLATRTGAASTSKNYGHHVRRYLTP